MRTFNFNFFYYIILSNLIPILTLTSNLTQTDLSLNSTSNNGNYYYYVPTNINQTDNKPMQTYVVIPLIKESNESIKNETITPKETNGTLPSNHTIIDEKKNTTITPKQKEKEKKKKKKKSCNPHFSLLGINFEIHLGPLLSIAVKLGLFNGCSLLDLDVKTKVLKGKNGTAVIGADINTELLGKKGLVNTNIKADVLNFKKNATDNKDSNSNQKVNKAMSDEKNKKLDISQLNSNTTQSISQNDQMNKTSVEIQLDDNKKDTSAVTMNTDNEKKQ
ncbi:hypothetical protein K502DRAFT_347193 [Neoconidiobolus thromboides FSU 785]|nr:hypothetical protein K502DRAFT_347193 [Neoconidiobolus thromboides FSU 785]